MRGGKLAFGGCNVIDAVIVEDSELARFELEHQLKAHPQIRIVGQAADVFQRQRAPLLGQCLQHAQADLDRLDAALAPGRGAVSLIAGRRAAVCFVRLIKHGGHYGPPALTASAFVQRLASPLKARHHRWV